MPLTASRPVLDELARSLNDALGEDGAPGGTGLPVDVDDTATVLLALALLGRPRSPEALWNFDRGDHFFCFPEERTPSTSANAHVVLALGTLLATPEASGVLTGPERKRCTDALSTVVRWLIEQQEPDGSWSDKWHASPFYATLLCAVALATHGAEQGAQARRAVERAVDWVLAGERDGGGWGRWFGTREETAYAVRLLLQAGDRDDDVVARAAARGADFLLCREADDEPHPPLWHDKDIYTPTRIVRTEIFAALYAAHTDPRTAALLADPALAVSGSE